MSIELVMGPPISGPNGMSKEAATQALKRHPEFPKGADFTVQAMDDRWVAAFVVKSEFPPSGGDQEEESPAPKSEPGGDEGAAPEPSDSGSDEKKDDGGSDGPPSDGGDGEEHKHHDGDKGGGLHEIKALLDLICTSLGIDPTMALGGPDSMVPGPDGGLGGPPPPGGPAGPPPGPPGAGGPPPGHGGPPGEQKIIHQRALKPGEVPPGGTPMGSPSFSSVKDHPWANTIGKVPHFRVAEEIGDRDIVEVENELQTIARAGGFKVARFTPFRDENNKRHVTAVISTPKSSQ